MRKKLQFSFPNNILIASWIVVLILLIVYLFTGGLTAFTSDSAAPVNLALEMIRTNELFPDGWIGSTGIFILQYPIWVFLHFTSDYLFAKSSAQVLLLVFFLLAVAFCARKLLKNHCWIIYFLIVCSACSTLAYDMMYLQCAYTSILIMEMLLLGLVGWAAENFSQGKIRNKRFLTFLLAICFACFHGILCIGLVALPLWGAMIILVLQTHGNEKLENSLERVKNIFPYLFLIALAMGIGTVISHTLGDQLGVIGNSSVSILAPSIEQITHNLTLIFEALFFYSDFSVGAELFSLTGILSFMRLSIFVVLTVLFPIFSFMKYQKLNENVKILHLFAALNVVVAVLVVLTTNIPDYIAAGRYLFVTIFSLQFLSSNYIYEQYIRKLNLLGGVYTVVISLVAIVLSLTLVPNIINYKSNSMAMKGITDFLAENDLKYGYATFWNAGKNTILSNGTVQINGVLLSQGLVEPYYWLTSRDWYDPDYYKGKTFLLLTPQEVEIFAPNGYGNTLLGAPEETLNYDGYVILVFDRNISENNFTLPIDGTENYTASMVCSDPDMLQTNGTIKIANGQIMYGPYLSLEAGQYVLKITADCGDAEASLRISSNFGEDIISMQTLKSGENIYYFTLDEDKDLVEFATTHSGELAITIQSIYLSKEVN